MKFSEYKYERIDFKDVEESFNKLIKEFNEAGSFEEQNNVIKESISSEARWKPWESLPK